MGTGNAACYRGIRSGILELQEWNIFTNYVAQTQHSTSGSIAALTLYQGGTYTGAMYAGTDNDMYIGTASSDAIRFYTSSNNTRMVIASSGNVGIGTENPACKLSVDGKILSSEIKVLLDISEYPDFVFADSYQLEPLSEVEKYIRKHRHLSGIPRAEEVKEGLALGEMSTKLLQKIEELTLYIIEQNKRIEKLEKELEKNGSN